MILRSFRIRNYRSINDSGNIKVTKRTALVGRNESGKSNLLLALASLNPPEGLTALNEVKDFPRDRPLSAFKPSLPVVDTTWELTSYESQQLGTLYPRTAGIKEVSVGRHYNATRWVGFGLGELRVDHSALKTAVQKFTKSATAALRPLSASAKIQAKASLDAFVLEVLDGAKGDAIRWATSATTALNKVKSDIQKIGLSVPGAARAALDSIATAIGNIDQDEALSQKARDWVVKRIPTLVYISDYPDLDGHQDLSEYQQRKQKGTLKDSDREFEKLMKVAGLDPSTLHKLLDEDHERRQQLANRAGAVVTQSLRRLWTDRALKVRFNPDGTHFDTLISDPEAIYDVEINLNERSLGFRWFFSFYMSFAADTQDGDMENAILLMDEPGLHLHAVAQQDLLQHFDRDFANQIIFTTHSPFMIPVDDLDCVRTVKIDADEGSTVSNDPTGDQKTLFPLQTALGYSLTQSLFVGPMTLVVEGVTDYWYLSAVADYLAETERYILPKGMVITPAGGAQRISYMVALLASQRMKVVVLLDSETAARRTASDLVKLKLIREDHIVYVSEPKGGMPADADIEDLLSEDVFDALVQQSYRKELKGVRLSLRPQIPRIVKRYEMAFEEAGLEFHKSRPARQFLEAMGRDPASVMVGGADARFQSLLVTVSEKLRKQVEDARAPFR